MSPTFVQTNPSVVASHPDGPMATNAFAFLQQVYPLFHAICGFSATLTPSAYFRQALGFDETDRYIRVSPAFPPRRLAVRIGGYVDLRYREREAYIDSLCESIARCYRARPGNYLVFFSAYSFMRQVYDRFGAAYPEFDTRLQRRDADETGQQQFLESFF